MPIAVKTTLAYRVLSLYAFLKEAQEKTDEITAKFLDKEKDPLNYRPQPIVTASSESAAAAVANASTALNCEQCNKTFKKKSNLLFHVERVHQTSAPSKSSSGRQKSSQQQQQVSFCQSLCLEGNIILSCIMYIVFNV